MRGRPEKWWQRLTAFWDGLCAACEDGLLWLLHSREALGLRPRAGKAPPRWPYRPSFEILEDVLAPGNLLSAASAFGVEGPANSDTPPASSAPATPTPSDTPASADETANEDTDPAPQPAPAHQPEAPARKPALKPETPARGPSPRKHRSSPPSAAMASATGCAPARWARTRSATPPGTRTSCRRPMS